MEYWSNGIMENEKKGPGSQNLVCFIRNTPVLHYSNTPVGF